MRSFLFFLFVCFPFWLAAQRMDVDIFGGISNYQGDLKPTFFTIKKANPAVAVILKYGITPNIFIRTGFTIGSLQGNDDDNADLDLRRRNLGFQTKIQEFTAGVEYRFLKPETFSITPYVFLSGGVFHYNPYTYTVNTGPERIYLRPLSTEGQGLTGYPDRKNYSLTQFCIPYGVGIKWQMNCNLNFGFEFRQTKTFTDYIDDVSSTYVDRNALLAAKGQRAVDLAWRGTTAYPPEGSGRGNPALQDWYYFAGITVGLKLNDCETGGFSLGGIFKGQPKSGGGINQTKRRNQQTQCPKPVW